MAETKNTKVKKTAVKEPKIVKTGLALDILDHSGKVVGSVELSKEIFGVKPNKNLLAQAVRTYLANQRQGNADTKGRGEIRGGGRKPWRQKGTGRARIGSIRAPHWRGGGVIFGPNPKDYSLELPKKMRRAALISALSSQFAEKNILVVKDIEFKEAKTKEAFGLLKNLQLTGKTLIITSQVKDKEKLAFRNIENSNLSQVNNLNTYQVLDQKKLLFTKEAVEKLPEILLNRK